MKYSVNDFVKIALEVPFKDCGRDIFGWDCWGLYVCFFNLVHEINIEPFDGITGADSKESKRLFEEYNKLWKEVELGKEKVSDGIVFRGEVLHIGVIIKPQMMIHTEKGKGTYIESYLAPLWKRKIIGIFRYEKLTNQ